jgi:hypothetical protein
LGRVSSIGHNWYEDHVGFEFDIEFHPTVTASTDSPEPSVRLDSTLH